MPLKSVFQWLAGQKQAPPVPTTTDAAEPRDTAVQNPNIPAHPESTPLAAQIRNDWLFGNWAELAAIPLSALEPEPERAELAVLIAAAHMQQATQATAQTLLKQARQWGAADPYITRTLTALAHQSLGAAQASQGSFDKALQAYQQAVLLGGSSAYLQQAIQQAHAHIQEHTPQPNQPPAQAKQGPGTDLTPALAQLQHLQTTLESSSEATQASFKKQADELIRVRKFLEAVIKKEVTNVGKQTQAFVAIQNYLTTGHLPAVSTEFNSWPISPDFSLYLINLLETEHYELVIEFGSGYSTELIARVLQNQNNKHPDQPPTLQVAFEHLEPYYKKTRGQLQVAGLLQRVQLLHAPLAPWQGEEDKEYPYYTASTVVQSLEQLNLKPDAKILVLVDGPPAATGPHARYPAFPLVNAVFPRQAVHYLMDDYIRDDEKEIVKLWQARLTTLNRTFTLHETKLEKDACLIRVDAL